jgi:hypothetical protein
MMTDAGEAIKCAMVKQHTLLLSSIGIEDIRRSHSSARGE